MAITFEEWAKKNNIQPKTGNQHSNTSNLSSKTSQKPQQNKTFEEWAQEQGLEKKNGSQFLTSSQNQTTGQPQQKEQGFFQGMVQEVAKTPLSILGGLGRGVQSEFKLLQGGLDKLRGDETAKAQHFKEAHETIRKPVDFGYFGNVAPIGSGYAEAGTAPLSEIYKAGGKEIIGKGLELGPYTMPGQAYVTTKGMSLLLKLGQFAKFGAAETGAFMAGSEIQKPDSTPLSVGVETLKGIGFGAATGPLFPLAGKTFGGVIGFTKNKINPKIANTVEQYFTKAIRPSVSQKGTLKSIQIYFKDAEHAVTAITANKKNLNLTNEFGEVEIGILPQSLNHFSQAINQTKETIYSLYNSLNKIAGKFPGAKRKGVELVPIADELDKVALGLEKSADPDVKRVVNYINSYSQNLRNKGSYSLEETQNEIKRMNEHLKSFYRNPTYTDSSTASIESMVANRLRKTLDEMITSETGPGYQQLRNLYKSLKTIEKDVNHRTMVDARKNIKGFFDITDIFTAGQLTHAILTLNPAQFAQGLAQKGIKDYFKFLNNPNNIIKKMFSEVEKQLKPNEVNPIIEFEKQVRREFERLMRGEGQSKMLPPASFIPAESTFEGRAAAATGMPGRFTQPSVPKPEVPTPALGKENIVKKKIVKKKAKKLETLAQVQREFDKRIDEHRRNAGLMAQQEGAGVSYKPINDATGNFNFMAGSFSKKRRDSEMKRMAKIGKKQAEKDLLEIDPEFVALKKQLDELKRIEVDKMDAHNKEIPFGGIAGIEPEMDEEGNVTGIGFDPKKALLGIAGMAGASKMRNKKALLGKAKTGVEESLAKQAKKYKSADEFIKAQTGKFYHGTPGKEFDKFKLDFSSNSQNETRGLGVWVTNNKKAADAFSKKIQDSFMGISAPSKNVGGTTMDVVLNIKNPKVYKPTKGSEDILKQIEELEKTKPSIIRMSMTENTLERNAILNERKEIQKQIKELKKQYERDSFENFMDDRDQFAEYISKGATWDERYIALNKDVTNKKFIKYLKDQGHDGILIKDTAYDAAGTGAKTIDQIAVFDPKNVLTKSQLTDIWNQVNKKPLGNKLKYNKTVNIQDKDDLDYLRRIFSDNDVERIVAGEKTNWRGNSYEELGKVNITSKKPLTSAQRLEGKIKDYSLDDKTIFHGTSAKIAEKIKKEGFKKGSELPEDSYRGGGYGALQDSISFSTSKKQADVFAEVSRNGAILKARLKPDSRIVEIDGMEYAEDLNDFIAELKKQKIDAVYLKGEKEIVVLDKNSIVLDQVN